MISTQTKTHTVEGVSFGDMVYVVYSTTEFYIHNGVDTLVVLQGDYDYDVTVSSLLNLRRGSGSYTLAHCSSVDIALDAFNTWKKI
jgi:hypothetical protein